jgi:hypothetical protein
MLSSVLGGYNPIVARCIRVDQYQRHDSIKKEFINNVSLHKQPSSEPLFQTDLLPLSVH